MDNDSPRFANAANGLADGKWLQDTNNGPNDVLSLAKNTRERLARFIPKLHEANEQCAQADKAIAHLSEMSSEQVRQLSKQFQEANRQWEKVAGQIHEAFCDFEVSGVMRDDAAPAIPACEPAPGAIAETEPCAVEGDGDDEPPPNCGGKPRWGDSVLGFMVLAALVTLAAEAVRMVWF